MSPFTKKISILCLLSILFAFCAHSEAVKWISSDPVWSIQSGVTFETDKNLNLDSVPVNLMAGFSLSQFQVLTGIQAQTSIFDFSGSLIYAPTFFNQLSIGFKSLFHLKHYAAEYLEIDFMQGLYAMYRLNRRLAFDSDFSLHMKFSQIYSIEDSMPWVKSNSFSFRFETLFNPIADLTMSLGVASYTMFRYNLFFAPNYWLGAEYQFADMFSIGTKALVEYVDMYTLSANRRLFDFEVYVKLEL